MTWKTIMADPITISLTAIPGMLAAIVRLSEEVQKFARRAFGASEEIRAIRRELHALRAVLARVQQVLETPNPHALPHQLTEGLPETIRYCRNSIRTLKNILHQSRTSIFGNLTWLLSGKDRVMSLLGELDRQKLTLNINLQVFEL
jgi:hypothetical protein